MADEIEQAAPAAAADAGALDLAVVRDLVLKANPNLVAELVTGSTPAELLASVPAAEAAYQRIAQSVQPAAAAVVEQPVVIVADPVSIGSPARSEGPDLSAMSPAQKIAYGVAHRSS